MSKGSPRFLWNLHDRWFISFAAWPDSWVPAGDGCWENYGGRARLKVYNPAVWPARRLTCCHMAHSKESVGECPECRSGQPVKWRKGAPDCSHRGHPGQICSIVILTVTSEKLLWIENAIILYPKSCCSNNSFHRLHIIRNFPSGNLFFSMYDHANFLPLFKIVNISLLSNENLLF